MDTNYLLATSTGLGTVFAVLWFILLLIGSILLGGCLRDRDEQIVLELLRNGKKPLELLFKEFRDARGEWISWILERLFRDKTSSSERHFYELLKPMLFDSSQLEVSLKLTGELSAIREDLEPKLNETARWVSSTKVNEELFQTRKSWGQASGVFQQTGARVRLIWIELTNES